ncbi:hypothetical protein ACQP1W_09900 [Spirillospora sp. CA-255316]
MTSMLIKSAPSWTRACPAGSSMRYGGGVMSAVQPWSALKPVAAVCPKPGVSGGAAALRGGAMRGIAWFEADPFGLRLRDLRDEQRVQDEQGRTVFELEGTNPSAPATAHVDAISTKGGTGPYPWRRPV